MISTEATIPSFSKLKPNTTLMMFSMPSLVLEARLGRFAMENKACKRRMAGYAEFSGVHNRK